MKVIYSGLEGSGKSLKLAKVAVSLVRRNAKWFLQSGVVRPIVSNMQFSESFTKFALSKKIPIKYWSNLDELIELSDCDLIIDEVGTYFDSRGWENLSLDVRRWLQQADKVGVEVYGSAQDFAQVDKAFRRLVSSLWWISKVIGSRRPSATKPPVKTVWGLCMVRELEPMGYDEDKSKFKPKSLFPTLFIIDKYSCEIFDTKQRIAKSKPLPYKHTVRYCGDPSCNYCRVIHS